MTYESVRRTETQMHQRSQLMHPQDEKFLNDLNAWNALEEHINRPIDEIQKERVWRAVKNHTDLPSVEKRKHRWMPPAKITAVWACAMLVIIGGTFELSRMSHVKSNSMSASTAASNAGTQSSIASPATESSFDSKDASVQTVNLPFLGTPAQTHIQLPQSSELKPDPDGRSVFVSDTGEYISYVQMVGNHPVTYAENMQGDTI